MAKKTTANLRSTVARARLHRTARQLIMEGKLKEAAAYAESHAFKLADIPGLVVPPEPLPKPVVHKTVETKDGPKDYINGWPVESHAMIWSYCRNKRLVVIHLADDDREAAMWTDNRQWRLGTRLRVKLEDAQADPRYLPIPGSIA